MIYSLIVPIALLDLWITAYQAICFRMYGIARVRRSGYIVIDRQHLAYLNGIEKLNCMYCGYANGVLAYVLEVAGRTEQFWCPIRHARRTRGSHAHYREFVDYGDAEGYKRELPVLRAELKRSEDANGLIGCGGGGCGTPRPPARWVASASRLEHGTSSHSSLRPMMAFAETAT